MSVDVLGTSCDQCRSMVQYIFTSTETRRLVRTDSPGRPPRLTHSSWTAVCGLREVELGSHSWMDCHVSLAAELFRPPLSCFSDSEVFVQDFVPHSCQSSGAVWKSRWPSWAFRPNDSSLTVLKQHWTVLTHWSQLVPNNYVNRHLRTWSSTSSSSPHSCWNSN